MLLGGAAYFVGSDRKIHVYRIAKRKWEEVK